MSLSQNTADRELCWMGPIDCGGKLKVAGRPDIGLIQNAYWNVFGAMNASDQDRRGDDLDADRREWKEEIFKTALAEIRETLRCYVFECVPKERGFDSPAQIFEWDLAQIDARIEAWTAVKQAILDSCPSPAMDL